MKLYKSIAFFVTGLALSSSLTSCVDLDQEPKSFYTQENYKPGSGSFASLSNGVIKTFRDGGISTNGNYAFNTRIIAMSLGADDMIDGKKDFTRLSSFDQLFVTDNSGADIKVMWELLYSTVQAASSLTKEVLLNQIPVMKFDSLFAKDTLRMEEEFNAKIAKELIDKEILPNKDKELTYLGEAYFMRALSYFYLVRFWGAVPCFANHKNTKSVDGTMAVRSQIPRTKVEDIYNKMIIRDLELAILLLPKVGRTGNNSKPSQWAAKATLADVYLTMAGWPLKKTENYAKCYTLCEDIIKNGGFSLTGKFDDLWKLTKTTDSNEHLFALHHFVENNQAANYGLSYYASEENVGGGGWSDYLLDPEFYKTYPEDDRVKAMAVTEFENSYKDRETGKIIIRMLPYMQSTKKAPAIKKFRDYGPKTSAQTPGITPIYRYAEVLLMYAEAFNKATGAPNNIAIDCVNEIRSRSKGKEKVPANISSSDFDELVANEYGWELAVEGKRWLQLIRREEVIKMNKRNPNTKSILVGRGVLSEMDAQTGKGYLMPLLNTAVEAARSAGVPFEQNPGY